MFFITLIIGIIGVLSNIFCGKFFLSCLTKEAKLNDEEFKGFKIVLFFEQMSLFTSIWASMIMIYIMAYKKNANIFLWLNILRIATRMFCLWICHFYVGELLGINRYFQFGISTSLSNIIVLIVIIIFFIRFIKEHKKIELNQNLKGV